MTKAPTSPSHYFPPSPRSVADDFPLCRTGTLPSPTRTALPPPSSSPSSPPCLALPTPGSAAEPQPPPQPLVAFHCSPVDWIDGVSLSVYHLPSPTSAHIAQSQCALPDATPLVSSLASFVLHAAGWATSELDMSFVARHEAVVCCLRDGYGEIVGTASAAVVRPGHCWVGDVVIGEAYRGIGLGSHLITELLTLSREVLWDESTPVTFSLIATRDAEGLYRRVGFKSISTHSATVLHAKVAREDIMQTHSNYINHYNTTCAYVNPHNITTCKHVLVSALRYYGTVVHSRARLSALARTAKTDCARTALVTDNGNVVGAGWGNLYDEGRKMFIGPVVAQSIAGANAAVRGLVEGVLGEEGVHGELEVGMVSLNLMPRRQHGLVWKAGGGDGGIRFRGCGELRYMANGGRTTGEEVGEGVNEEVGRGEVEECDSSRYFCLAGYIG